MKHLLLFERYSQPFAVGKLSTEVCKFIKGEFEKWVMRKGLANYSHYYDYIPTFKNPDFPVSKIKLKLIFVLTSKYNFIQNSGKSYYKIKYHRMNKDEKILSPKIKKNGDTEIGIEIKIYIPKYKKSFGDMYEEIESVVMHEIQHSHRNYKLQSKEIKKDIDYTIISRIADDINKGIANFVGPKEWGSNNKENEIIHDFFNCIYICSNESETESYLSQLYAIYGDEWVEGFLKIRQISFEKIWKVLLPYEDIINKCIDKHDNSFILKYCKGYSDCKIVMKYFYDLIQKKKEYIFKKMMKIKASIE